MHSSTDSLSVNTTRCAPSRAAVSPLRPGPAPSSSTFSPCIVGVSPSYAYACRKWSASTSAAPHTTQLSPNSPQLCSMVRLAGSAAPPGNILVFAANVDPVSSAASLLGSPLIDKAVVWGALPAVGAVVLRLVAPIPMLMLVESTTASSRCNGSMTAGEQCDDLQKLLHKPSTTSNVFIAVCT